MILPPSADSDQAPPLDVRFTAPYRELVAALRAINGAVPFVRRIRQLAWVAIAVIAALIATSVLTFWESLGILFFPGLVLLLFWIMPFHLAWAIRRQSPYWTGEQLFEFSDGGIRVCTSASETLVDWAAIMRTAENRRFFLFFSADQAGHFIPKRVLSPDLEARLRQLFQERAGKPGVDGQFASVNAPTEPATVEASFELDAAEAARAGMVAARKVGGLWIPYAVVLAIVLWTTLPTAYVQWQRGGWAAVSIPSVLWGLAPLLMLLFGVPLIARWAARRALRTGPSTRGTQLIGVAEWGIRVAGPMYTGDLRWPAFMHAVETEEFFLFFLSRLQPLFIPKRLLTGVEVQQIRGMASTGLGSRAALMS